MGDAGKGPVSLDHIAESISVAERIALTDARVRAHVSYAIASAFVLANVLTLAGVAYMFHVDSLSLAAKVINAQERVITPPVVMSIIGATTVQLGALAFTMGKYLFPVWAKPPGT